jgi:hypothetical protein
MRHTHEGFGWLMSEPDVRCDLCGRRLLTPQSRAAGRGVVCARNAVSRALDHLRKHYNRSALSTRPLRAATAAAADTEQLELMLDPEPS